MEGAMKRQTVIQGSELPVPLSSTPSGQKQIQKKRSHTTLSLKYPAYLEYLKNSLDEKNYSLSIFRMLWLPQTSVRPIAQGLW